MESEGQTPTPTDESHGASPAQATVSSAVSPGGTETPSPFFSKLSCIGLNIEPMPHPLELGICDFFIGDSSSNQSETQYQDGLVALSREDFKSFEPEYGLIPESIICVWANSLNYKWKLNGKHQACMPLVNTPLNTKEVLFRWKNSIKIWKLHLHTCEKVLIPFHHREHIVLLVVNFSKKKLHCVDIRLQPRVEEWDRMADSVICMFYMLLMELGDDRCNLPFHKFEREVMSPHWGSPTHTDDGMCVMQLMECFDESTNYLDNIVAENYPLFIEKRLSCCGQIAMTRVNHLHNEIMSGFIHKYRMKRAAVTSTTGN